MLLELNLCELLGLRALVWALMKPRLALLLQMMVQLVIADGLRAAVRMVWTLQFELVELLLVELVDLARRQRERVATVLFIAYVVELLGTSLANDILTRLALHCVDNDEATLGAKDVLVDVDSLRVGC